MANILIVGCGDIGIPLGMKLINKGHQVWGLRRSATLPDPIVTITADVCKPETLQGLADLSFDYVVVTLTPGGFSDEAYQSVYVEGLKNVLAAMNQEQVIKKILFVSSTSVYAQTDGRWVDESSPTEPSSFSGKRLLEAERVLQNSAVDYCIVRFAGIYGPGRNRMIEQVRNGQGCPKTPTLFTNRIHRDDCVGFLGHLIDLDQQEVEIQPCYIGVDDEPVSMWAVKQWLAEQLEVDPAALIEEALTRRNSKRCSNKALRASGYQLLYPTFQQGYAELLANS